MTVMLRPARSTDAGTTGAILEQFQLETSWMPKQYSGAESIAFCGKMIDRGWVTVAVQATRIIGFIARDDEEICALYVSGGARGNGVGRHLMDDAKTNSGRLWLRVFEVNTRARKFYVRSGFREISVRDGEDNEENLPDIRCVWQREAVV